MDQKITVSYFKCDSQMGEDLFKRTKSALEQSGVHGVPVEVTLRENDPFTATEAYLCDDVVIFDGSLGGEVPESAAADIGAQYDAMIEPMKSSDHVLIVSRTPVPFNVTCVWKGGYPKYIKTGEAVYKETLTNEEILLWIMNMFAQGDMQLLNPHKIEREYFRSLPEEKQNEVLQEKVSENADRAKAHEPKAEVFISYLSRYSRYAHNPQEGEPGYTVEDLIEYISATQGISKDEIGYFPPGQLSQELMTTQRRWEIVSVTDDFISTCSQFWILDAPGYWSSWWTLSERITLSYKLASAPEQCPDIYVASFMPKNGGFKVKAYTGADEKKRFLPKITQETVQNIARYFANSRPGTVGYESVGIMILMHHLPKPAVDYMNRQSYKLMKQLFPATEEYIDETMEEFVDKGYSSVKSYAYTKSFWNDWVMECPYCKEKSAHKYSQETFLKPVKSPFCRVVKSKALSYIREKDEFEYTCKGCGRKFYFEHGSYYRWYPVRGTGIRTGPGGRSIEKREALFFAKKKPELET